MDDDREFQAKMQSVTEDMIRMRDPVPRMTRMSDAEARLRSFLIIIKGKADNPAFVRCMVTTALEGTQTALKAEDYWTKQTSRS